MKKTIKGENRKGKGWTNFKQIFGGGEKFSWALEGLSKRVRKKVGPKKSTGTKQGGEKKGQ